MIPLAGCVLAGGRSTRMGGNKAQLRLGSLSFHALAVEKLLACTAAVFTCGEHGDPDERRSRPLIDPYRCGPLGGMVAALEGIAAEWVIFLPVDMPLVPVSWLQHLVSLALAEPKATAIVTRSQDGPQPLVSVCNQRLLPRLRLALEQKNYSVWSAMGDSVLWSDIPAEMTEMFLNLNTQQEVSALRVRGFDIS